MCVGEATYSFKKSDGDVLFLPERHGRGVGGASAVAEEAGSV